MDGEHGQQAGDKLGKDTISTDSGEQQAGGDAVFPDLKLGEAWGESITRGRAAELEARLQAWGQEADHGKWKGPLWSSGDNLLWLTGADVFWLVARTLAGTKYRWAVMEQMAVLRMAQVEFPNTFKFDLSALNLQQADLSGATLSEAILSKAHLAGAFLRGASLAGADLSGANLVGAYLSETNLANTDLSAADLSKVNLDSANLSGANLSRATFDTTTDLTRVRVTDTSGRFTALFRRLRRLPTSGPMSVADLHWNEVDLTVVDWSGLRRLGDERPNRNQRRRHRDWWWWRSRAESEQATRANTQLAKRLRDAGMNDDADRFAYRAQVRQRGVHLLRGRIFRWLFSWLLFVVAGYGYRPLRTLFWYLAVIFAFAVVYFSVGPGVGVPLSPLGSLVFSITSFHGRGFFPGGSPGHSVTLDDPLTVMAALEAVVGLFIEISFIATFTQRYFGK